MADRFARYMHQPPAWAANEYLDDWRQNRARWYETTRSWTERNQHSWPAWFDVCTPAQRRRLRKSWRKEATRCPSQRQHRLLCAIMEVHCLRAEQETT